MDEQAAQTQKAEEEKAAQEEKIKNYNAEYQKMLFYCNSLIGDILKTTTVLNKNAQMLKIGQIKNEFNRRAFLLKEHFFKKNSGAAAIEEASEASNEAAIEEAAHEEAVHHEEVSNEAAASNEAAGASNEAIKKELVYYQHPENNIQLIIAEKSVP